MCEVSLMRNNRGFVRLLGLLAMISMLLAVAFAPIPAAAKNKKKKPPRVPNIFWPGPPSPPRIKLIDVIETEDDVVGARKASLMDKLAGRKPIGDKIRLEKPYGIVVDRSGRIYIADPGQRSVLVIDREGKQISKWRGNSQIPLLLPVGVALADDGRLFVADSYAGQIVVFNSTGVPVSVFGKGDIAKPGGMVLDNARKALYVCDFKANKVLVFDSTTYKLVRSIGGPTKTGDFEPGSFAGPANLALDAAGNLYVSEVWNCRVQVFDSSGKLLRLFGKLGVRPGNLARPKGIAVDSDGHVYVADAQFNNFQVFSTKGKPLLFVGNMGLAPGQFLLPAGLYIDSQDRIYVTEQRTDGGRLQVFQYLGETQEASARKKKND